MGRSVNVLVVDDDPDFRETVQLLLEDAGHCVRAAEDGVQALRLVERQRPELLLVDLDMPVMSGNELIAEVQRTGALELSQIVVMSARPHASAAKWHIPKPMNRDLILEVIRDFGGRARVRPQSG